MKGRLVLGFIAATVVVVVAQGLGLVLSTVLGLTKPNLTLLTLGSLAMMAGFACLAMCLLIRVMRAWSGRWASGTSRWKPTSAGTMPLSRSRPNQARARV